jgi:hypothetical protein
LDSKATMLSKDEMDGRVWFLQQQQPQAGGHNSPFEEEFSVKS